MSIKVILKYDVLIIIEKLNTSIGALWMISFVTQNYLLIAISVQL
ncbi:MAG: hypothetical protein ACR5KW_03545 [Wolbachia sp.]